MSHYRLHWNAVHCHLIVPRSHLHSPCYNGTERRLAGQQKSIHFGLAANNGDGIQPKKKKHLVGLNRPRVNSTASHVREESEGVRVITSVG